MLTIVIPGGSWIRYETWINYKIGFSYLSAVYTLVWVHVIFMFFWFFSLLQCMPWFLAKRIVGHLSRRLQQLDIKCETKTKVCYCIRYQLNQIFMSLHAYQSHKYFFLARILIHICLFSKVSMASYVCIALYIFLILFPMN
jgi:hypothetical protein